MMTLALLLMAATTHAWATDVYVVGNGEGNWLNGILWAHDAPENKMTEQNGVYSITFTDVDATTNLQFKFAINGSWNVNYGCSLTTEIKLNKTISSIEASDNILFGLTEPADVTISFNLSELTFMISTKGMKVGDDTPPVPLTRGTGEKINEWTLTNGMPAGNVTVSVDYFAQAELAKSTDPTPVPLAPTAIPNVPANTDGAIVTPGTVANIGTSEVKQGTLMYFVKQADGNTAPTAPDYDDEGWDENVPTANGLKQGNVYVWYYIEGAEPANIADRTDANTRSDSDIKSLGTTGFVTLGAEPTYDVTLNADGLSDEEAAAWKVAKGTDDPAAFPLEGVKKSETVTVTYSGDRKVIGVKAEKKSNNPYANAQLGDLFYSDGTFSSTLEAGKTPIGVIAYLDQEGTDDDEITEKSNGAGHGLVLCLKNAASGADTQWSMGRFSKFPGQEVTSVADLKRTENVSGYTNTATLTVDATTAEKYPAAKAAKNYTGLAAPTGTTGWFLPSAQQWVKMIEGLGGLSDGAPNFAESWFDNNHTAADKWEAALSKAGNGNYDSMTSAYLYYPSSSEYSADNAVTLYVDATDTAFDYGFFWVGCDRVAWSVNGRVRPVLAF